MHATIPKGEIRYDQYTVPDTVAAEITFADLWSLVPFLQISLKNSELKTAPTISFGIVVCTFSNNLSRNSCIFFLQMYARREE